MTHHLIKSMEWGNNVNVAIVQEEITGRYFLEVNYGENCINSLFVEVMEYKPVNKEKNE